MDGRRGLGKDWGGGWGRGGQGSHAGVPTAGDYAEREVGGECSGGGGVTDVVNDVHDVRVCVRSVTCCYEVWCMDWFFFFVVCARSQP